MTLSVKLPLNFTASVNSVEHKPQIHLRIPSSPIINARFAFQNVHILFTESFQNIFTSAKTV